MEALGRESRGHVRYASSAVAPDPADDLVPLLYKDFRATLFAQVLALTNHDRQWTEDVVQETMIRAWRSAERLDPNAVSLMPWLATVARRIVIDDRRRRDARPQESGDGPLASMPVPDEMEGLLHQVVVSEALKALSPAHREILNETILRDRTVNQAAATLGIPVGTVKSRVYYALRELHGVLAIRELL